MVENTLYYTFSAIPQTLGAIAAILATFIFVRIADLKKYLIGDGKTIYARWGEPGYCFPNPSEDNLQNKRLRDAIYRGNIPEIKDVIKQLSYLESTQGRTKATRPTGLQYVYENRFCNTENYIIKLKKWVKIIVTLSFATIIVSIISLAMVDIIISTECSNFKYWILRFNVSLFILSIASSLWLIILGLSENTMHETDREGV